MLTPLEHDEECHIVRTLVCVQKKKRCDLWAARKVICIGRVIGLIRGASRGYGMLEASRVKLEEKRKPKIVALSVEETAIVLLEWKRE